MQGVSDAEVEDWIAFHTARERQWYEIARLLIQEEPCELAAVLFDGVDKLQHLCYHLLDPRLLVHHTSAAAARARALCLDYFRQLDGFIESLVAEAGGDTRVFIASDHGFTAAGPTIFYANVWLERRGWLTWHTDVPLDDGGRLNPDGFTETGTLLDWRHTVAFAMTASSNGIFIRRSPAPDRPGVASVDYDSFRRRLAGELLAFEDPAGEPVVDEVLMRDEAFPGEQSVRAPDLTLKLRDRGFLSVLRADEPLKQRRAPYGTHHPHGIFLARGPGLRAGAQVPALPIAAVAPTLLYSLGLPIRTDMEAAPAFDAFSPAFVAQHRVAWEEGQSPAAAERTPRAPRDSAMETRVLEGLKALGYIE